MAPTLREILDRDFTDKERSHFVSVMRLTVENNQSTMVERFAYLQASKSGN